MTETALLPERKMFAPSRASSPVVPRYWAFLSYSHRDTGWADWPPQGARGLPRPGQRRRVRDIGGDGAEQARASVPRPSRTCGLRRSQRRHQARACRFAHARALLARGRDIALGQREIATFKRLRPDGCVLAAIVDGEPFASERPGREAEECFPASASTSADALRPSAQSRSPPISTKPGTASGSAN